MTQGRDPAAAGHARRAARGRAARHPARRLRGGDGRRDHPRGGRQPRPPELPLRIQGRGRRRGVRRDRPRASWPSWRRSRAGPTPPRTGSSPTSTPPSGATARAGRCGSTPGAARRAWTRCRPTLARYAQGWRAALADVLADGASAGDWTCEDPDETAALLVAVIDGIGLQSIIHPREVPPARASDWARRVASLELGVELPEQPAPRLETPERTTLELRMPIRGRDLDAGGTVHPAVQLAFLEEARGAWLDERLGTAERPLLARVAMDFRGALRPDGRRGASSAAGCAGRGAPASAPTRRSPRPPATSSSAPTRRSWRSTPGRGDRAP